ncbi:phosphoenolpyruvate--protein phosphotransferase [Aeromicrobium fastidiosum]|uniref:Phosphoenolpyruvate-protein phosphotransferase n=1 Tax=Aeromicrobium fastidiosum TaxID=52699 RepID=A0A641AJH0_9ACTN|nr:phosphoenolpyruvate--protein phosphotransferase [Aeromicrobium fastidiosum]KAA1374882.1 phosphoenolpyruvate--protein phosphotransferase [Aeromicrobium fastidiosum]MBP2390552.1 phosphotransferase system enzyme I (PtsI) [Aeromicrobium fastidiosum]
MSSSGTPVVPGVGTGPVVVTAERVEAPTDEPHVDRETTVAAVAAASEVVADRLTARAAHASGAAAEVLQATAAMARDRGLATFVAKHADASGPATAVTAAVAELAAMFSAAGGLMAERVTDLHDVRDRVVAEVLGLPEPGVPSPDVPSVLFADDLAPADTAGLDPERIVAIAIRLGGATSHTAIIARQLGIPCVVGVRDLPIDGSAVTALVDGSTGEIVLDPDPADASARAQADAERRAAGAAWTGPGATSDGHAVQVLANVQDAAGAVRAAAEPIEGFGLYRTELSFLDRSSEPTVDEQTEIYAAVLDAAGTHKVVVRTLDAGSDKPLAFADMGTEPNPALGVRGLRIATERPELLDHQLDAIAAAAARSDADVWVMAPMVAVVSEAADVAQRIRERGLTAGVMIETPSAALLADRLLEHVDFVSIGTNDLSQYTFAADRMASSLSHLTDPWQPALLMLVSSVAAAGERAGKPVGVCGEAAADPMLACVLVGLGVTSLSCAASAVRSVGAMLATVTLEQCREAAEAALAAADPAAGRDRVRAILA